MKSLKSQSGMITVDFMFSIVLILGLSSLLFVLSFTLSVASVTQYITFATARNFAVAHIDKEQQAARAQAKYLELLNNPVLKTLYTNGWYSVDAQATVGDQTKVIPGWEEATEGVNEFWGAGTNFTAKVLDFHIPFFGSTVPDSGDGGKDKGAGFRAYMSSNLGREPTEAECIDFTAQRWTAIRNLQVSGGAAYSTGTGATGYFPMTDDGC
jgi:hypothetical protein